MGADGNVVFARSYSYTPRAPPEGYSKDFIERLLNDVRRNGRPVPEGAERAVTPHVPRFLPPVSEVRMGADASIWLRREIIPGKDDPVTWWVLNERGDPVGQLHLPGRFQLRHVDRDTVWGIEYDELDVNYVVRYRIQK